MISPMRQVKHSQVYFQFSLPGSFYRKHFLSLGRVTWVPSHHPEDAYIGLHPTFDP
jgi:hypothetical protein